MFLTDWIERLSETQFAYLLLLPTLSLLGAIAFWPLASTLRMSLHADKLVGAANIGAFVGLENYVEIVTGQRDSVMGVPFFDLSQPFQSALPVTLLFAGASVVLETLLGLVAALALNREFTGRRWVRVALILPWSVPIVIQGMMFYLMFAPGVGFATPVLSDLGIIGSTPLNDSFDAFLIVLMSDVWKTTAFMMLLILAGLQSIDRKLYDVSRVAGASKLQRFKMITLPLVLPTIVVAMLFRTINAMRVYGLIESISGCGTVPSLSCTVVSTFSSRRYGTSSAIAFITALVIASVVLVYLVQFARDEQGAI